jgi:carbonic anhydrase
VDNRSDSSITAGPASDDHYQLAQFHFHSPSEHTVNGRSFDMEMHLVHKNASGGIAVVAVLIAKGHESALLARVLEAVQAAPSEDVREVSGVNVDLAELVPAGAAHYAYTGSLTAPPCTEGVRWFVLEPVQEAGEQQIARFREMMHGPNNRPVQPLGTRRVLELKP